MSAWFVEENTVADAVACLKEVGLNPLEVTDKGMGILLWSLNAVALGQRYGDPFSEFKADIEAYNDPPASDNAWQRYKSLGCLIYQCSEGDVPENILFKAMQQAEQVLACKLMRIEDAGAAVSAAALRKEYSAAQWGRK